MGCGESKHAVATQNTISKSKSKSRSKNQEQKAPPSAEISKNDGNVSANSVKDSDSLKAKKNEIQDTEISKKVDEKEEAKENGAVVCDSKVESEVKAEEKEIKNEKKEEREEAAAAAEVEVVQEKKEEIKNEESVREKQEEVKAEVEEQEEAAAVEVVQEKQKEEIKNEELKEEKKDEVKVDDQEEKENIVSHEAAIDSSCAEEKISEGENNTAEEGNEGKEEGLKVVESKELDQETKPSAEVKTPADQMEGDAAAPTTDVKGN